MKVGQGTTRTRKTVVKRHSPMPGVSRIPEAPETEGFEEHMPFHERVCGATPSTRRSVRAGTRRIQRHSMAPGLPAVSEHIDYPPSPITTRSPAAPPCMSPPRRHRPIVEEGEKLIDIPCGPCTPQAPQQSRPSRIKRTVTRRRIDFDTPSSSPEQPKPCYVQEEPDEAVGPPPEDLMGLRHPVQYETRVICSHII